MMCSRDPLFYVNAFVWTYDPRLTQRIIPFITWPYQDRILLELIAATGIIPGISPRDILAEKTRDMGLSWLCVLSDEWAWKFREMVSFLWVSRKEDLVDKVDDPKSLFWKFDFTEKYMAPFLVPAYTRTKLHVLNHETGSTIDGESTTGEVGRGDRRTSITLDEFAAVEEGWKVLQATADATDCRKFNSTAQGTGNAFFAMRESGIHVIRVHWTEHPKKAAGLWYDGDGKPHSPWYDGECERRASRLEIAQELDIDYHASGSPFFDLEVLQKVQAEDVRPPFKRGELIFEETGQVPKRFVESEDGFLLLWTHLMPAGPEGKPSAETDYTIGVDISAGGGASNSVISVGDNRTGEKVAEYANSKISPEELAKYAVAVARWFGGKQKGATIIWEDNGSGAIFGRAILDAMYPHIYFRRNEKTIARKPSDTPGWYSTRESKKVLLGDYRRALAAHSFINRCMEAIKEARDYVHTAGGSVEHTASMNEQDPTGARDNHGDRVIADALCSWLMKENQSQPPPAEAEPQFCLAARRRVAREKMLAVSVWDSER